MHIDTFKQNTSIHKINKSKINKKILNEVCCLPDGCSLLPGIPNLITADMIKEGAAVIDVGINRIQDPVTAKPKLVGDVDFEGI